MTLQETMSLLQSLGSNSYKSVMIKHGATEPFFGVKIEELKKIQKKEKGNQELALELYDTGNSDAMYLAGLIADGSKMTEKQLQQWAEKAPWHMISEYTVPWVTSENAKGLELALNWIEDPRESVASTGWSTLAGIASLQNVDIDLYRKLLARVTGEIHQAPNRVRFTMNAFLINVGSYVPELHKEAIQVAEKIGTVIVNMGDTACKVPSAGNYIRKTVEKGQFKKKKTIKC